MIPRSYRATRLTAFIASPLHNSQNIKETARQTNVSISTVGRVLDTISYSRRKFSTAISIDEFRGNASTGKFQCILVEPVKHKVLDILPDRQYSHLVSYFSSIPKDERYRVKHFVCDMWKPYIELAYTFQMRKSLLTNTISLGKPFGLLKACERDYKKQCLLNCGNTINEAEHSS